MSQPPHSRKAIWILVAICCVLSIASIVGVGILLLRSDNSSLANASAASGQTETLRLIADRDVSLVRRPNRATLGKELDVGFRTWVNGEEEYHTALHVSLPDTFRNKPIVRAELKIHYFGAWGTFDPRAITAHRIMEDWNAATARFTMAHGPALATNVAGGREAMWITWDVTAAAKEWAANPSGNYGVVLVPGPEPARDNSLRFASTRATNDAVHPMLEITFGKVKR